MMKSSVLQLTLKLQFCGGIQMCLLLGPIAVLYMQMWPIVTNLVVWSVGSSVCHSSEPCKTAEPIEMPFGLRTWVGPRNHVLEGVQIPMGRGSFKEKQRWPIALGQLKTSYLLIFTKLKKLFFTALLLETSVFRLLCQELKELNKQRYLELMLRTRCPLLLM